MKKALLFFSLLFSASFTYAQCYGGGCGSCGSSYSSHQNTSSYVTNYHEVTKIEVAIYPNPTSDYIRFEENNKIESIRIYNLNGTMMKSYTVANDQVYSIADLNVGMYIIQFYGKKNKVLNTQRIQKASSRS